MTTEPLPALYGPDGHLIGERQDDERAIARSVVEPRSDVTQQGFESFLMLVAQRVSDIVAWGSSPKLRDRQLRDFIPTEPYFNSALGIIAARNAALAWAIRGDERIAEASQALLNNANFGLGWEHFITTLSMDLYTTDNGAFVEMVREQNSPESPVIGINTLDSLRCFQTGNPEFPVLYEDRNGRLHRLAWYQVVHLLEMPSAREDSFGGFFVRLQYCALTRALAAVEIIKSIGTYKAEKLGSRSARAVHLVAGISTEKIQETIRQHDLLSDMQGRERYVTAPIVGTVDVNAKISKETLELASLPDGWNEKESLEAYVVILSMAFLTDYQEFAPLPGGNLGTSQQSQTLHLKSRGKGAGLFQSMITRLMNLAGVLPADAEFGFDEDDPDEDEQHAKIEQTQWEGLKIAVDSTILTLAGARQIALDKGLIPEEVFEHMQEEEEAEAEADQDAGLPAVQPDDLTPEVHVEGDQPSEGARAAGPVAFGPLILGRLHRAYATTSDDVSSLGYFEDTKQRRQVASAVGPALDLFERELRAAGVWEIEVAPEDADRIVEASLRMFGERSVLNPEEGDERMRFEETAQAEIARGLAQVRRRISARIRERTRLTEEAVG